jgi:hypothetical protein
MTLLAAVMAGFLGLAAESPALVVQAPDAPVKLDRTAVLTVAGSPPVVLYAATNLTGDALEQFTVMVFVFKADGALKARQTAPGRRTLEGRETKYSTIVLDGSPIEPTDIIVIGVNQVQKVNSDAWWRADLQPAAEIAVPKKP